MAPASPTLQNSAKYYQSKTQKKQEKVKEQHCIKRSNVKVLKDYKDQFVGTVFIGKRSGFMDEYNTDLKGLMELGEDYPAVQLGTINETIDAYCAQLANQLP